MFYNSTCSGLPYMMFVFENGKVSWQPSYTKNYVRIFCSDGATKSGCAAVNATYTPLFTDVQTATTTASKQPCPFECCFWRLDYENKFCAAGSNCINNTCVSLKADCPFECCENETGYSGKPCGKNASCAGNKCVSPVNYTDTYSPVNYTNTYIIVSSVAFISLIALYFFVKNFAIGG